MSRGDNLAFRAWARAQHLVVKRLPEPMRGDHDSWHVPLTKKRGMLWDAGDVIGVHVVGGAHLLNRLVPALTRLGATLRTLASDGAILYVTRASWTPAIQAALAPRRYAPKAQGAAT